MQIVNLTDPVWIHIQFPKSPLPLHATGCFHTCQTHIPGRGSSAALDTSGLLQLYSFKVLKDEGTCKVLLQQANAGQRSEGESHLFLLLYLDKPHPSLVFYSPLCRGPATGTQAYKHLNAHCAENVRWTKVEVSWFWVLGSGPQSCIFFQCLRVLSVYQLGFSFVVLLDYFHWDYSHLDSPATFSYFVLPCQLLYHLQ